MKVRREDGKKECTRCGKMKPLDEFVRNSQATDGRRPECKECHRDKRGFERRYRRRSEGPVNGLLLCLECNTVQPLDQFYCRVTKATGQQSYSSYCQTCRCKRGRKQYHENPTKFKAAVRDGKYGLKPGEYEIMLAQQGGCCAICGYVPQIGQRPLSVDHDHTSGSVRGLLCGLCNTGLGNFRDESQFLRRAISYLEACKCVSM
jgi:hypothetical protein